MKLTFICLLAACLQVSASSFGQAITLNENNASLKESLKQIQHQSGYSVLYDAKLIRNARPVTLQLKNAPLKSALDECFKNQPFNYTVQDKTIVITPAPATQKVTTVMLLSTVTGQVTDNKGQPIAGVTVSLKGTTTGTVTDNNGKYSIQIEGGNPVLVFSSVGYDTQEIDAGAKGHIDITLAERSSLLNDVVVVGYNTQRKIDILGSVSTLQAKDIANNMVADPLQSLEGRVPGLQISQSSGQPGAEGMNLLIRGQNSFAPNTNNSPLILINGVVGDISELDPSFIESVTVLKDAASATIYGARAANGVILVTTKTGANAQKLTVDFNSNYVNQNAINEPARVWNSAQYMTMLNTAIDNAGGGATKYSQDTINLYKNPSTKYPSFNWENFMFRPIDIFNNTVSIGGKSGNTNFQAGAGVWDQNGIVRGFDYKKYTGIFSMDSKIGKRFKFGVTIHGLQSQQKEPSNGTSDEILATFAQIPDDEPTLSDGSGNYSRRARPFEYPQKNPYALANQGGEWTNQFNFNGTAYAQLTILDGLVWEVKGGFNDDETDLKLQSVAIPVYNYLTNQPDGYANDQSTTSLTQSTFLTRYYTAYSTLKYDKTLFKDYNLDLLAGVSEEKSTSTTLSGYRYGFASPSLDVLSAGPTDGQTNSADEAEYSLRSFFGSLNANYKHKYLIGVSFRDDGSSRFPPDFRHAFFPSFSAGWNITEESFMQENAKWLDELKLRATYGQLGNDNVNGNYPYQSTLTTTANYPFSSLQGGVGLNNLANDQLKWEQTSIKNIGLDFNIKNSILYGSVDYFDKQTSGILRQEQVPGYSGVGSPWVNEGVVSNKGYEIVLGNKNQIGDFAFGEELNFSAYKNKVIKFGAAEYGGTSLMKEGYEINNYYMYQSDGIYQSQAEINSGPTTPWIEHPGDVRIKDVNGDGKITPDDRVPLAGAFPNFYYGMHLFASYKNFDLSVLFQGQYGNKVLMNGQYNDVLPFAGAAAPLTYWENSWTPQNHSNTLPVMDYYYGPNGASTRATSSFWLEDASYTRLKNLTLGYTLPSGVSKRIGLSRIKIFVSGENLFTFTKFKFGDPETGGGIAYPMLRSLTAGLNVQF